MPEIRIAYFAANQDAPDSVVETSLGRLEAIKNAQIGIISLNDDLDVETVSAIFNRINSKGVPLSSGIDGGFLSNTPVTGM